MGTIDAYGELMKDWDARERRLGLIEASLVAFDRRLRELEAGPVAPPGPGGGLPRIPMTCPPLLRNKGSWDDTDIIATVEPELTGGGGLFITIGQKTQPKSRVVRCDFGLQDPAQDVGRGGFLREPAGKLRRYEIQVGLPMTYDSNAEMVNLSQFHTDGTTLPPYLSFFLWTKDAYLRHNRPNGVRVNHNLGPIKPGHDYKLRVDALWSDKYDGVLSAWVDGELIVNYHGANFEGGPPYYVFGPYAPSAIKGFVNMFHFSDLRIGDIP